MNEITKKLNTLVKKSGNNRNIISKIRNVNTRSRFVNCEIVD